MIRQHYEALLRVFQHALHDGSNMVRSQVCKADLKETAAKFFLWGDALGLREADLEIRPFPLLRSRVERHLLTMADLIVHVFQPGFESFALNELLLCASDSATRGPPTESPPTESPPTESPSTVTGSPPTENPLTRSLPIAETDLSSSLAAHQDEDAEAQYADPEVDQLLENIDFCISCLAELSPSIQRYMEHDAAELIPLPPIVALSSEPLRHHSKTPDTLRILEERYPKAAKELLIRLCKAEARRDASQARVDFGLCTFDECWAKYRIFEGFEWANHEFSQHRFNRSWTCLLCQRVEVDQTAWLRHLSAAHSIDLKGGQLRLASQFACQVHSRPVEHEECPFCGECPASTREEFEKHVGAHFKDACEFINNHADSFERTEPGSPTEETDLASIFDSTPSVGSSLDTLPPSIFSANPAEVSASHPPKLPPPKAVEWQCGACIERPVMKLAHHTHCCMCYYKFDVYSTYYDRRGRRIQI